MRICAAQIKPIKGDVQRNVDLHVSLIDLAVFWQADIIVFPELSLTGYEPEMANELATNKDDNRFAVLQEISDGNNLTICAGMPVKKGSDVLISMLIFQPHQPRHIYSKQSLHEDELAYFVNGSEQVYITINDMKIAPAICYESLLHSHAETVFANGANIYIASVAKSVNGIDKAYKHYPDIAKKYRVPVLMANCVGTCDNFEAAGQSSVWDSSGELAGKLDDTGVGILIFDTETEQIIEKMLLR